MERWFVDYLNPTHSELKLWMEDSDAFEPMQDWDLIIGDHMRLPSLVRLANNEGPQREYIVHYLHVSTAVAFSSDRSQITEGIKLVPGDTFVVAHFKPFFLVQDIREIGNVYQGDRITLLIT